MLGKIIQSRIVAIFVSLLVVFGIGWGYSYLKQPSAYADDITNLQVVSATVQYDLGIRYVENGNHQEAIVLFEVAIDINPKMQEAYLALSDVYIVLDAPEEAVDVLEQGLEEIKGGDNATPEQDPTQDGAALEEKLEEVEDAIKDSYGADYEITWAEPMVEQGVRQLLGKPTGVIMRSELDDIASLYVYGDSYFGTEPLVIQASDASSYQIDGVSYGGGDLENLADFAHFKGLKSLTIRWNKVKDVTPLNALTRLRYLDLSSNQIKDIAVLGSNNANDFEQELAKNAERDLDELEELIEDDVSATTLLREVLGFKSVAMWRAQTGGLASLANIQWLPLEESQRQQLATMAKLADVGLLGGQDISKIEVPTIQLSHLRYLDLSHNYISNISAITYMRKLETVLLADNKVVNLMPFINLAAVQMADLQNNPDVLDWSPVMMVENVQGRPANWMDMPTNLPASWGMPTQETLDLIEQAADLLLPVEP